MAASGLHRSASVVCVPARDEAARLPALLRSLSRQGDLPATPLRVVVLANNCRDGTAEIARTLARDESLPHLALRVVERTLADADAHAGSARRLALDAGAEWLATDGVADGVLLTTDADARVPPDWIEANLRALRDAELVGGRLVIAPEGERDPALLAFHAKVERYWDNVRALEDLIDPPSHDPPPRHGDHTGASLAVRVRDYHAVGGLPALPRGEDNAFVARIREDGGRVRHCPGVSVLVSDRLDGRAAGGMACEMRRRAAASGGVEGYLLPSPAHWQSLLERRAAMRRTWRRSPGHAAALLRILGLGHGDVAAIAPASCRNDIAFVERARRRLDNGTPVAQIDLDAAPDAFAAVLSRLGTAR